MEIQFWQIAILTIYGFIAPILNVSVTPNAIMRPVTAGILVGFIMGDLETGLLIGGTLELTALGVATYGGASVPDYFTASVIGTALSISGGLLPAEGVALAIPVAVLMVQLDVLGRLSSTLLAEKARKFAAKGEIKPMRKLNYLGTFQWGLTKAIPISIALIVGPAIVVVIIDAIPEQISTGLVVAVGILPVLGIAMLLRFLPFKQLFVYFLLGFMLISIFDLNLLIVTIIAGMLVYAMFTNELSSIKSNERNTKNFGGNIDD